MDICFQACAKPRIVSLEKRSPLKQGEKEIKMKKLTVLLLTMAMSFSMIACGNNDGNGGQSTEQSVEQSAPEKAVYNVAMEDVRQAVVDALGENYWPQMAIPAEFLEGFGLTADLYEEFFGEMPMISTNVDTLIVVKAKEDKIEEVEKAINAYRDNLVNDTMQYPMNVGKIQASEVKTFGNYVCFVQLGADVMTALEKGDEEVIKHCQAQNAIAIEALENVITK